MGDSPRPSGEADRHSARVGTLDVESSGDAKESLLGRPHVRGTWTRRDLAIWACLGSLLLFLVVMAAVFTGRGSSGSSSGSGSGGFQPWPPLLVPPGGIKGCEDQEALCVVARPVPTPGEDYRGHPRRVSGRLGVVASDQSRCADIGVDVLEEGGHAADAAVAVALCQGVVNPFASGVGGGFFAVLRSANGSAEFINAREVAPGAADKDMYSGRPERAPSLDGGLAIGVPLELKGLELAWKRHGRVAWARLVAPAAAIARHGFAAHPYYVYVVSGNATFNRLRADPLTANAFLVRDARGGVFRPPRVGELCCRRPVLADTLEAVGKYGVSWLYEGERLQRLEAEIQAAGGIITTRDFQLAAPRIEPLLRYRIPGPTAGGGGGTAARAVETLPYYDLVVPYPPSSGAVLALALRIVLGYGMQPEEYGTPLGQHRVVEALKHAFAARMALGDPGTPAAPFANVTAPLADFADPAFAEAFRKTINDSSVLPLSVYGGRWNPQVTGVSPDDHGTSHIAVYDKEGNAVSLTTTINTIFGSNVISRSTGILFNNEMDDFSQPGQENKYHLQPAVANYIAPYKRPLSSMSPAYVERPDGSLAMVVGASNGPRILSGIAQTILRTLYAGVEPLAAVSGARLHAQWQPDKVLYENYTLDGVTYTTPPDVAAGLAARGDTLQPYSDQLGDVQAILVPPAGAGGGPGPGVEAVAVADPRKDGAPAAASDRDGAR